MMDNVTVTCTALESWNCNLCRNDMVLTNTINYKHLIIDYILGLKHALKMVFCFIAKFIRHSLALISNGVTRKEV